MLRTSRVEELLPDEGYTAEVVLIVTSLGAKRQQHMASRRAADLLEIKRCHYKVIDVNKDTGPNTDAEKACLVALKDGGKLKAPEDTGDAETADAFHLPQVFIDGHNMGDDTDLQNLEDDGLLSDILTRNKCPSCNKAEQRTEASCACGNLRELLAGLQSLQDQYEYICMGDDEEDTETRFLWGAGRTLEQSQE
mmetsp:Transcript_85791/g.195571  ORF Transcript_85791/g.195571 Transcript_85791/m.195571 type:complete len:194 (-) Transcript_85791:258-839(-)